MQDFIVIINFLVLICSFWFFERLLAKERKNLLVISGIFLPILVLLATLPRYTEPYTVIFMTTILQFVILTVSWTIFSGSTGYMSLATAAFFGVGVYAAALLLPITGRLLPMPLVIIIGGLASFIVAVGVGALTLRLKGIYFAIFTFGLVVLIKELLLYWEINITGTRGRFISVVDNETVFYVILIIFVALMITAYFIRQSRFGLALQSIGENEEAASHIGVNVTLVKIVTFGVSAFFMGAAGAIMATKVTYIDPYYAFNPQASFLPVLMAIFGGMGQLYGPVIGAVIFAYLQEKLITEFPYYYMLIFGIVLVVSILYMPNGLVGLVQKIIQFIQKWRKGGSTLQNADT